MMASAAELLEGRTLANGWVVNKKIRQSDSNNQITGGNFSVGYEVEKDGEIAFLKAIDFSRAFQSNSTDIATLMQRITASFNFEKYILSICKQANIKRVVKLLDDGVEEVQGSDAPSKTQYLIFEWAESDVRRKSNPLNNPSNPMKLDPAWILMCMRDITSGLYQLHQRQIIHQDIKPSNVLIFEHGGGVKIGDFGRSYSANHEVEYNKNNLFPGDITYAPPEILYRYASGTAEMIRQAIDVYMLGSMLHFLFTQCPLTSKILEKTPQEHHYVEQRWSKDQIMPYLQIYYDEVIEEFEQEVPVDSRDQIIKTIKELTNLMPEKRGHPSTHRTSENKLSLQRYIAIFDNLSKKYMLQKNRKEK